MSALTIVEPTRLDQLADVANGKHREAYQAAMTMLYAGMASGEALIEAKAAVGHGGWTDWCKDNLDFGVTTASNYMLVARHKEHILSHDEVTTMQKALRLLKQDKLTSQTRIDEARIQEMRVMAAEHGYSKAASILGESFSTVRRYAQGHEKTKHVKPPTSGTRVQINSLMIERMAEWLVKRLGKGQPVNDRVRELALEALRTALDPPRERTHA